MTMLTVKSFIPMLRLKFPEITFYNSTIDKSNPKCVGIYTRGQGKISSVGGPDNGSYDILPISIIVHWTEDAGLCEDMANLIYTELSIILKEQTPSGTMISFVRLEDALPVHVGRDESNVVEKVIRATIFYERGA